MITGCWLILTGVIYSRHYKNIYAKVETSNNEDVDYTNLVVQMPQIISINYNVDTKQYYYPTIIMIKTWVISAYFGDKQQ